MADYKVELGVKVNTKDIDTAIHNYKGKPIEIKTKLDTRGIDNEISSYRAKKPIEINAKLNTTGLAKKIGEYKPKTPVVLRAELNTADIDSAISSYTSKNKTITIGVQLNTKDIKTAIQNYAATTKHSIEVDAKLNNDAINKAISNYQASKSIKIKVEPNFEDIDSKIGNYTARSPLKVNVHINKTSINEQLRTFTGEDQYLTVKAKLDNGAISQAIKDYKAKTPIKVDLALDHTDIDNKVSAYAKTPVQLSAKLKLVNDINAQVKKYKLSVPINLTVKQLDTSDIEEKIKGYTTKSSIKVGVKLDGKGISNQLKGYKINTPLKVVAELDTDSINSQIKGYKVTTPIKVALDLDASKINEKIKNYKIGNPIEVNIRLDNKSIGEQVRNYLAKTSIKLNVELDASDIEKAIRSYKASVPIKVGIQLDTKKINEQIKKYGTKTPIQVNVKLDTKNIEEKIKNYKAKSSIKVGVKLDAKKINEQIRNVKTRSPIKVDVKLNIENVQNQINDIRQQLQSLGNIRTNPIGSIGGVTGGNNNSGSSDRKQVDEVTQAYRELMGVLNELNSKRMQLNRLDASSPESSNKIQKLRLQIEQLDNEYNNLLRSFNVQGIQFTADQWNQLETAMAKVGRQIDVVQAGMADKSSIQSQTQAYKELLSISKEIGALETNIVKLRNQGGNTNQIAELENRLRTLHSTYQQLVKTMNTPLTANQWSSIYTQIAKASEEINRLNAQHADMRAELAKEIKTNISTGKLNSEINDVRESFNLLRIEDQGVQNDITRLQTLLGNMDSSDDIESVANDYQEFLQLLETVKNSVGELQRTQSNSGEMLDLKKESAMAKLNNLFEEGSQAAKKFGTRAKELARELNTCGDANVDNVTMKIKNLGEEVRKSNLQTKKFGTRLKDQFSKYFNYLSVASVFMYATQAAKSMFEQVKLIDSAMTELKKVTDETDATYDRFLSNAASKAKEIGTTIDGLVSSTADFARLGYGFEDAQKLAEVANIYAVVGDEIEGVEGATESLISTMAAFKDETSDISNTDFAMDIVDKFNEIGKLIA